MEQSDYISEWQNLLLILIPLYKVNRGFVNQQILKMSSKKS